MAFFDALFGGKQEQSVLGVDIGSSSLKVVQLRKDKGKAVLETYGELALGPYAGSVAGQATALSAEEIAESLRDLLREAKVTTKSAGVSIPFARSLLVLVELPYRKDPKEQQTVIELEARKYIPVPVSEVQLDWFIVPPASKGPGASAEPEGARTKVEVFLIAVHNDELALLQRSVAAAGLESSFFEIEIFSTIRAVVEDPVAPVMVLDIGAATTKTYVVERGVVALSHSISIGSQDITRAIATSENLPLARAEALKKQEGIEFSGTERSPELVFSRIFASARRVLIQYETAHHESVSQVVLTGGGGVTRELGTYAKNLFSIDVKVADPFKKCEAPAFMQPVLAEIGPEFAVAVGLALRKLSEL
jgi:type IV pilus assembly protein PilM